jgi:protein involved in polysaccharide export with SLBB domain
VTEFNQTVTVQPDGYVTLRAVGDLRVQGRTLPELVSLLTEAYEPILRDPVITVVLKDFEKPYFVAAGELKTPGKFELRGAMTVTEAVAVAGGFTNRAKHSQVVLFRRYSSDLLEVKQVNVKKMLATRDLSEDYVIRPGDTLFVPPERVVAACSVPAYGGARLLSQSVFPLSDWMTTANSETCRNRHFICLRCGCWSFHCFDIGPQYWSPSSRV